MVKNVVFSTITTLSSLFLFVLLIFVGRVTGLEQSGLFNTALFIATIFEMFTDLGMRDLTVRDLSRDRTQTAKYLGNMLTWKFLLCGLVYLAMLGVVRFLYADAPALRFAIYVLTISAFLKSLKYTFRGFFQAYNLFSIDMVLVIIERTSILVIGLLVLFVFQSMKIFIICFTLVRLVDFFITLAVLHFKVAKIIPRFDFEFILRLQKKAIPFGMFFIILSIYSYIDGIMLERIFHSFHEAGLYAAAFRVYEGVTIFPTIFYLVMLPRLSELFVTDKSRHYDMAKRAVKYMFIMAIPVVVYGIFYSQTLLEFFYSSQPKFFESKFTLQILFLGILFQYPNWMLNSVLMSIDKQKIMMYIGLIGLVFKILLNLWVIPKWGFNGAAVATVIGEALLFGLGTFYLFIHHLKIPVIRLGAKPVFIAVILSFGFYFGTAYVALIPLGVILAFVYLGLLLILKVFDSVEMSELKNNLFSFGK
jgi:O-antigen/teichoic acid export membrane protein